MNLFIAEKPSLGRTIAEYIGIKKKYKNYIECYNDIVVTWCFGHILELAKPDYYLKKDTKKWTIEDLPIIPQKWKRVVKKDAKTQFSLIKQLISQAGVIINAGDPDREGQLLVDEVIEYVGVKKPVKRIWLQALDNENIQKALSKLADNGKYLPYKLSAEARSYADWLIGMNLTRYFTVTSGSLITVGRVQTPTLALVVERDNKIKRFKPHDYYVLTANLDKAFKAVYMPDEDMKGLDEENRLIDKNIALDITNKTTGKKAVVVEYQKTQKQEYPPLPFMLSSLQKFANAKYGLTANNTLAVAQNLYEKKLTTYPRTDCPYIAEEQYKDAPKIVKNIKKTGIFSNLIDNLDFNIKHKAFNTSKVTAHTAIIPTGDMRNMSSLKDVEMKIYLDIVKAYLCLFQKPYKYYGIQTILDISGYKFKATFTEVINKGFKEYCLYDTSHSTSYMPPDLIKGRAFLNKKTTIDIKQTTPPAHFTDGTLIDAMSHIYRYIDDEKAKKILKENDGIGTEATRAQIIEQLIKRGFLVRTKKKIVSTEIARDFIAQLPDFIKDPVLTAKWERELAGILDGRVEFKDFLKSQENFIREHINKKYSITLKQKPNTSVKKRKKVVQCPECGDILLKLKTKTGKNYYFCRRCKSAYWINKNGSVGSKWNFNKKQNVGR